MNVAYVDPTGLDNMSCGEMAPCKTVTAALATGKPYVKLHGTTNEQVSLNNASVTFLADPGAILTDTTNGILIKIDGASHVAIYDLTISGASGANNPGISLQQGNTATVSVVRATVSNNTGGGISASGGTLTVSQSTLSGNTGGGISASGGMLTVSQSTLSGNTGGGISISGSQFDIANCFIVSNGGGASVFGGVKIDAIGANASAPHRLDFNTITANVGPPGANLGIQCGTVLTPLSFSSDIVYANVVSGGGQQVAGMNCSAVYSDVGPDADSPAAGTGDINADPKFIDSGNGNFHLMSTSPAKDAADPTSTLNIDFDGDPRPQGSRSDIGADEIKQ